MDELLADEQAMGDITMSENAMKYLARSTGFADAVCANETFMTLLGQSAYIDATVLNSDIWRSKIFESDYRHLIYKNLIPTMTSNTSTFGEASSSRYYTGCEPYRMFDKHHYTGWEIAYTQNASTNDWAQLIFTKTIKCFGISVTHKKGVAGTQTFKVVGILQNDSIIDLITITGDNSSKTYESIVDPVVLKGIKVIPISFTDYRQIHIDEIELYGLDCL